MDWSGVGDWLKDNAGSGVALVGSLLTGNVGGAYAAGMALVSQATGTDNPAEALKQLQGNPETMVKLKELYYKNEDSIRGHTEEIARLKFEDKQREHETTQRTIVEGQRVAEPGFEKKSRPAMAWFSLIGTFGFAFYSVSLEKPVDLVVLGVLSAGYLAWMGLRTMDKLTIAKHGPID